MSQSFNSLDLSQKRTLNAWKIALKRVNIEEFPESLRATIEQIEDKLSENNYQVLDEIPEIVKNISDFCDAYQTARQELAEDYNSQERNKIAITWDSNYSNDRTANAKKKTKQKINPKALFILQELETYPLTLEDLKYRLQLPSWEVHQLVKQLWKERKINKVSGNIWYSVFPITKPRPFDVQEDDSDTYFTVTSLGKIELRTLSNSR
ncbi:hypothetical protein [Crocosphaera sp.]|uniref:hypothetical protein n=1 Tax=Crocosphaera sp. TaxID=2729996 RepID=UPI003F25E65B|nr:hypothetical protein [Crocosphaera sp.]